MIGRKGDGECPSRSCYGLEVRGRNLMSGRVGAKALSVYRYVADSCFSAIGICTLMRLSRSDQCAGQRKNAKKSYGRRKLSGIEQAPSAKDPGQRIAIGRKRGADGQVPPLQPLMSRRRDERIKAVEYLRDTDSEDQEGDRKPGRCWVVTEWSKSIPLIKCEMAPAADV